MKLKIVTALVTAATCGTILYLYNKPGRNIDTEKAIVVDAVALFTEFETNEREANDLFLDKVLEVTGVVGELTENQQHDQVVILESHSPPFGIACTLRVYDVNINKGSTITIKGLCTGYLSDVIIVSGTAIRK